MGGFYRIGDPGQDTIAHMNFGPKAGPKSCQCPRFPEDKPTWGEACGRPSVALCDGPSMNEFQHRRERTCDRAICELHRTKHATKPNTDYCPDHKDRASA